MYQKGAYYSGVEIFNRLPFEIKGVAGNLKQFKTALKQILYACSVCTLEEYCNQS